MKINKKTVKKKSILIIVVTATALVVLLGYGAYAIANQSWPFASPKSSQISEANTGEATPRDTTSEPTSSPKTPTKNENSDSATPSENFDVTITAAKTSGDNLQVSSLIKLVTNKGSCTLTLEKGNEQITKTSDIHAGPSSSTCKGFTVPLSDLSAGTWHLHLSVQSNKKTGSDSRTYEAP